MLTGQMVHKLKILKPKSTVNDYNEKLEQVLVADVWASKVDFGVNERFASGRDLAIRAGRFHIHYRKDLTDQMVVLFENRTYQIIGIKELGYREGLELILEQTE